MWTTASCQAFTSRRVGPVPSAVPMKLYSAGGFNAPVMPFSVQPHLAQQRSTRPARRALATCASVPKHAVVIGGGVGGLTVATKLARAGMRVTVLEQHATVGGRCQSETIATKSGTYRFDTGPSLLLFPHVYCETFLDLGSTLENHADVRRVEPAAYRVWFEGDERRDDPSTLDLLYDTNLMLQQLEAVEPGSGPRYLDWLSSSKKALEVGTREFIERDFDGLGDYLDIKRLLPLLGQVDVLELIGQHSDRLSRRFKDPRIRAMLSFQDLYVGLTPYTAPGVFSLLAATEVTDGVWYPIGGFQTIKDGLANIAQENGVFIRTRARVGKIEVEEVVVSDQDQLAITPGSSVDGYEDGEEEGEEEDVEDEYEDRASSRSPSPSPARAPSPSLWGQITRAMSPRPARAPSPSLWGTRSAAGEASPGNEGAWDRTNSPARSPSPSPARAPTPSLWGIPLPMGGGDAGRAEGEPIVQVPQPRAKTPSIGQVVGGIMTNLGGGGYDRWAETDAREAEEEERREWQAAEARLAAAAEQAAGSRERARTPLATLVQDVTTRFGGSSDGGYGQDSNGSDGNDAHASHSGNGNGTTAGYSGNGSDKGQQGTRSPSPPLWGLVDRLKGADERSRDERSSQQDGDLNGQQQGGSGPRERRRTPLASIAGAVGGFVGGLYGRGVSPEERERDEAERQRQEAEQSSLWDLVAGLKDLREDIKEETNKWREDRESKLDQAKGQVEAEVLRDSLWDLVAGVKGVGEKRAGSPPASRAAGDATDEAIRREIERERQERERQRARSGDSQQQARWEREQREQDARAARERADAEAARAAREREAREAAARAAREAVQPKLSPAEEEARARAEGRWQFVAPDKTELARQQQKQAQQVAAPSSQAQIKETTDWDATLFKGEEGQKVKGMLEAVGFRFGPQPEPSNPFEPQNLKEQLEKLQQLPVFTGKWMKGEGEKGKEGSSSSSPEPSKPANKPWGVLDHEKKGLKITGVTLDNGEFIAADVIVSNRDVALTYELLNHTSYGSSRQKSVTDMEYSAGIIAYNFCVKGKLPYLAHHNVFLSNEFEKSWQRPTAPNTLLPHPNFYVHCPSRTDPTAAPEGCESVMVLLPVANMQEMVKADSKLGWRSRIVLGVNGKPDYRPLISAGRQAIADTFKHNGVCDDFLSMVEEEMIIDPVEWKQRYGMQHGAAFGLSHGLNQLALFRPAVKDPQVKGLYMVGASARPGNGVPLVMISASLAAQRVCYDVVSGAV